MKVPPWITLAMLALVVLLFVSLLRGLYRALERNRSGNVQGGLILAAIGLLGWLAGLAILARQRYFDDWDALPPPMAMVIIIPTLGLIVMALTRRFKAWGNQLSPVATMGLQSFRVVVEIILWRLVLLGKLPAHLSFEGYNLDILIGITAPIVAYFIWVKKAWPRWVGIVWNGLGVLVLTSVVVMAVLSFPTPFRVFTADPPSAIMARFPMIWLPGFLVPCAFLMHFVSLVQLLTRDVPRQVE